MVSGGSFSPVPAMDGAPLPSVDRSQAEDRSTAIDAMMSGLEFQGFGFG